jgi:hypothetical protein
VIVNGDSKIWENHLYAGFSIAMLDFPLWGMRVNPGAVKSL